MHISGGGGLSGFLTGVTVNDPVDGTPREFDELERRATGMEELLDSACAFGLSFSQVGPH